MIEFLFISSYRDVSRSEVGGRGTQKHEEIFLLVLREVIKDIKGFFHNF